MPELTKIELDAACGAAVAQIIAKSDSVVTKDQLHCAFGALGTEVASMFIGLALIERDAAQYKLDRLKQWVADRQCGLAAHANLAKADPET